MIENVDAYRKKADLHLELLWDRNTAITAQLVSSSTILKLFNTVSSRKIAPVFWSPTASSSTRYLMLMKLSAMLQKTNAIKIIIEA
jgi:hypothetical protein